MLTLAQRHREMGTPSCMLWHEHTTLSCNANISLITTRGCRSHGKGVGENGGFGLGFALLLLNQTCCLMVRLWQGCMLTCPWVQPVHPSIHRRQLRTTSPTWLCSCPFWAVSPNTFPLCYHCELQNAFLLTLELPRRRHCPRSLQNPLLYPWEKTTTWGKCASRVWTLSHASDKRHVRHHEISRKHSRNSRWARPKIHRRVIGCTGKACPHGPGSCFGLRLECDPRSGKCQGLLLLAIPWFRYWPSQDSKLETTARYRHLHIARRGLYVHSIARFQLQVMLWEYQALSTQEVAS